MPFYAVRKGREPGIYETWREAERQTYMFAGAEFRKFETQEQADAYMGQDQLLAVEVVACSVKRKGKDWVVTLTCSQLEGEYEVDGAEYKKGMAVLYAFSEFLQDFLDEGEYRPSKLILETTVLHVKNVLDTYLDRWEQNLWCTTRGPVDHVPMLQQLRERIKTFNCVECQILRRERR